MCCTALGLAPMCCAAFLRFAVAHARARLQKARLPRHRLQHPPLVCVREGSLVHVCTACAVRAEAARGVWFGTKAAQATCGQRAAGRLAEQSCAGGAEECGRSSQTAQELFAQTRKPPLPARGLLLPARRDGAGREPRPQRREHPVLPGPPARAPLALCPQALRFQGRPCLLRFSKPALAGRRRIRIRVLPARPAATFQLPSSGWRWEAPASPMAAFITLVASLNSLTLCTPQTRRLPGGLWLFGLYQAAAAEAPF